MPNQNLQFSVSCHHWVINFPVLDLCESFCFHGGILHPIEVGAWNILLPVQWQLFFSRTVPSDSTQIGKELNKSVSNLSANKDLPFLNIILTLDIQNHYYLQRSCGIRQHVHVSDIKNINKFILLIIQAMNRNFLSHFFFEVRFDKKLFGDNFPCKYFSIV